MSLNRFADALYLAYRAAALLKGTPTVEIEPVVDLLVYALGLKHRSDLEESLSNLLILCLRKQTPYRIMFEVDATWTSQAAFQRRKRENQVWVDGRPVRIMEMSLRKED
jgi:hypothetical protein